MYEAVLAAQLSAMALVRDGASARGVDSEARRVLRKKRLDKRFTHSLGHGLGLDVHEHPRLAPRSRNFLKTGQVVTVEPGVYIPGVGGVRIEDDVVVRQHGVELLTRSSKAFISL
jgi:Xaa-Pro aminopeptidase